MVYFNTRKRLERLLHLFVLSDCCCLWPVHLPKQIVQTGEFDQLYGQNMLLDIYFISKTSLVKTFKRF